MRQSRAYILTIIAALIAVCGVFAQHQGKLKVDKTALKRIEIEKHQLQQREALTELQGDSAANIVKLFGYDKPHNSVYESVFIKNLSDTDTIVEINVNFVYLTLKEEKIHEELKTLPCSIPPQDTRRVQIKGWDKTQTFYYYRTPPRRKEGLNPYKVSAKVKSVWLKKR